jgi:hypothetical protein
MFKSVSPSTVPRATGIVASRGGAAVKPEYVERRQFGRRPCRIAAEIRYRRNSFACIVLDQSEGGAFLSVADADMLPSRFQLVLPDNHIEIMVEVRHRAKDGVGVQFLRGDIATFRDTFCKAQDDAKAEPAVAVAAAPAPVLVGQAGQPHQSPADLRRALFHVVAGGVARARSIVAAVPLVLRRQAGTAVVVGATMLLASRRLAAAPRSALEAKPVAEICAG